MANQLYGDGIHDDTTAIQEMLDAGTACVQLPEPRKNYLVTKGLIKPDIVGEEGYALKHDFSRFFKKKLHSKHQNGFDAQKTSCQQTRAKILEMA